MSARYEPDNQGFRQFMNSAGLANSMGAIGADIAAQANAKGKSTYDSRQRTVQGGRRASNRSGAEVYEVDRNWSDVKRRVLVNLSNSYRMRGGG